MDPTAAQPPLDQRRLAGVSEVLDRMLELVAATRDRPVIVAIDGGSASGKSTLADRLVTDAVRRSPALSAAVVRTDDVAWHHSFFDWAPLLITGVLDPLRRGEHVDYRPPAWDERGRSGAIEVPAGAALVIVEGVGASQHTLTAYLDLTVWVHTAAAEAERRGLARDIASGVNGDEAESIAFWHEWMAQERAFLARDRPWERADLVVPGAD